jgi:ATP-dependent DNA ligase
MPAASISFCSRAENRDLEVASAQGIALCLGPRKYRRGVNWVEPWMVVEVKFTTFTGDGILRHPSLEGVREDKSPESAGLG